LAVVLAGKGMLMFWLAEEWQELYHVSINAEWLVV